MEKENQIWLDLLDSYGLELLGVQPVEENLQDFNKNLELMAKRKPFESYQRKDERSYLKMLLKEGKLILKIKNPQAFILKNQQRPFKQLLPSFCYKNYILRLGLPVFEESFEVKEIQSKSLFKILGENSKEGEELERIFPERIKTDKTLLLKMRFDLGGNEKLVLGILGKMEKEVKQNISNGNALKDFLCELNQMAEEKIEERNLKYQ